MSSDGIKDFCQFFLLKSNPFVDFFYIGVKFQVMLTVILLSGVILLGFLIVVIAEKLDAYINRDSSLNNE